MSIFVFAEIKPTKAPQQLTTNFMSSLAQKSQNEQGCRQYDLFLADNDFLVFEEWQDQEALDQHQQTEHFKALVEAINADGAELSVRLINKL